jgi:Cys-tRNA(Pro)/Cys-tRNA(Cys) deacylase
VSEGRSSGSRSSSHRAPSGAGTPATVALTAAGVPFTAHAYEHHDTATNFGEEAAAELGLSEDRVFKTLVASADDELVVAVVPVARRLDLKALAAAVGAKKARLADPAVAERRTGYVVGGISPVARTRSSGAISRSSPRLPALTKTLAKEAALASTMVASVVRCPTGLMPPTT